MKFLPGESGNPNGRPKKGFSLAEIVREKTNDGADVVDFLIKVVNGRVRKAKLADRIHAAEVLLDRGFGKPLQSVELSGPDGGPIQLITIADLGRQSDGDPDA